MSTARTGFERALEFLAAPRMRQSLTIVILLTTLAADPLRIAWGLPGEYAALALLVVLSALSLWGMRDQIEWRGILPVSLLALLAWVVFSIFWSGYTALSAVAALVFAATAFLGVYIALARDLIQLVRAVGDALRAILGVSLVLEVLSGIIIDTPIPFLGIQGNLAVGGPIQGIVGSRNELGFLAGLALLTFLVEWRTRSVSRFTTITSTTVAAILVFFSGSPVSAVVLVAVGGALLALWGLRRMPEAPRRRLQPFILAAAILGAIVAWFARGPLFAFLDAASDIDARFVVWREILEVVRERPVEGWGWIGEWSRRQFPYSSIAGAGDRLPTSAQNVYLDAILQLGLVGGAILVIVLGLGIVRAWLVASESRSTVTVWPALVLLLLAATGLAENYPLLQGGLVLLVAACIAAARRRSWRGRLREIEPAPRVES